jgi:hypothetical protein
MSPGWSESSTAATACPASAWSRLVRGSRIPIFA